MQEKITFDTAKLAKRKGFSLRTIHGFDKEGKVIQSNGLNKKLKAGVRMNFNKYSTYSAPYQTDIIGWLWSKHRMFVEITLWGDGIGFMALIKKVDGVADDGSSTVKLLEAVETNGIRWDLISIRERAINKALNTLEDAKDN